MIPTYQCCGCCAFSVSGAVRAVLIKCNGRFANKVRLLMPADTHISAGRALKGGALCHILNHNLDVHSVERKPLSGCARRCVCSSSRARRLVHDGRGYVVLSEQHAGAQSVKCWLAPGGVDLVGQGGGPPHTERKHTSL